MKISGNGMTPLKHTGKLWNMAQWIRSPSSCFLALLSPYGTTVGCATSLVNTVDYEPTYMWMKVHSMAAASCPLVCTRPHVTKMKNSLF